MRFRLLHSRAFLSAAALWLAVGATPGRAEDVYDRLDQSLNWSSADGRARARLSGLLDLELYALPRPAPALIETESRWLFSPRLTAFLDAQLGPSLYAFAQARADRGFDPSDEGLTARLDEYAVRWSVPCVHAFNIQLGRFATVVGNWTTRHDAWNNPFITAPLPYENLTGVWDNEPPRSVNQLLIWSHVRPGIAPSVADQEKYLRLPVIWGPSYATGFAIAGELDRFRYALEMKNASLASRPETWSAGESRWDHPTLSGRVRYVPDPRWEFGWSASRGSFLRPEAGLMPAGRTRGDYRLIVLGQDVSFAWHHLQVWAEMFAARFRIPGIGNADTLAYYVEAKYKFAPRFFGAVRWNQQLYGTLVERGTGVHWGLRTWRFDLAPTYRLTAYAQVKLQYSLQWGDPKGEYAHLAAVQGTFRF